MKSIWAALLVSLLALPLNALEASKIAALETRIERFVEAIEQNDIEEIVTVMPPRFLGFVAQKAGLSVDEMRPILIGAMSEVMADATFENVKIELDKAEPLTSKTGRNYAFVPSSFTISMQGQRVLREASILALEDEGKWYLFSINQTSEVLILKEVYPDMTDVTFPTGKTSVVN